MNKPVYIGIVGPLASGKGIVTEFFLQPKGFVEFSLSPLIHEEMKRRGVTQYSRIDLQNVGNELRKQYGADIFARRAITIIQQKKLQKVLITGIRNTAEVAYLKTFPHFRLISINATQKIRYKRLLQRKKKWDPKTWSAFIKADRRDRGIGQNNLGQQVAQCMKMADYKLTNNESKEELLQQLKALNYF